MLRTCQWSTPERENLKHVDNHWQIQKSKGTPLLAKVKFSLAQILFILYEVILQEHSPSITATITILPYIIKLIPFNVAGEVLWFRISFKFRFFPIFSACLAFKRFVQKNWPLVIKSGGQYEKKRWRQFWNICQKLK